MCPLAVQLRAELPLSVRKTTYWVYGVDGQPGWGSNQDMG